MTKRIGIINSGGDCPGLNTVTSAVVTSLYPDYEVLGFYKGFEGLLDKNYIKLTPEITDPYRFQGGTFLKSVNKGRFAGKIGFGSVHQLDPEIIEQTVNSYNELGLEAVVVLGGDGTMATLLQLQDHGIRAIGVPKSIDNDLPGTDFTFGFQTAVEITTEALDRIATTAQSHDRIMVLEVMGRNAGWIALYSGIAGGASCILIPEILFDNLKVEEFFEKRLRNKQTWGLIVVAEGAMDKQNGLSVKSLEGQSSEAKLGGVGENLAKFLNSTGKFEVRNTVLGHVQRGGSPNGWDRILSRIFGAYAGKMVREQKFGYAVGYVDGQFVENSLEMYKQSVKLVNPNSDVVLRARELGICFGD